MENNPLFLSDNLSPEDRKAAIRKLNPLEIIHYSLTSVEAAEHVRDAEIRPTLITYDMYSGYNGPVISFLFVAGRYEFVLPPRDPSQQHYKANVPIPDPPEHFTLTTITGERLEHCFKCRGNFGCVTPSNTLQFVFPKLFEHFSEVFPLAESTRLELDTEIIPLLSPFFDPENKKLVGFLSFRGEKPKDLLRVWDSFKTTKGVGFSFL